MDGTRGELPRTVSWRKLVMGFLLLTMLPPAIVVLYTLRNPPPPEPELPVEVAIEYVTRHVETSPGETQPALVPTMTLRNPTGGDYRNVMITLNRAFYYRHDDTLPAGGEIRVPLAQFITKEGGIGFIARGHKIERATVFAQLPDGSRGVRDIAFDPEGKAAIATAKR